MDGQTYLVAEALGHADRFAAVLRLLDGEARERDLLKDLDLPQKTANRHLTHLLRLGLLTKDGQQGAYRLTAEAETRLALEILNRLAVRLLEIRLESDQALGRQLRRGRLRPTDLGTGESA